MSSCFFYTDSAEDDRCEKCWAGGAEPVGVPEVLRKAGGRCHLFLCEEHRWAQIEDWDTELEALRLPEEPHTRSLIIPSMQPYGVEVITRSGTAGLFNSAAEAERWTEGIGASV